MSDYQRKVDLAINLLRHIPQDCEIELSYSGGKDSDVILELAKMAGIPFRAIYKNTTIDPPYTIQHCREKGVDIIQPKNTFFDLIQQKGIPNRRRRFCCAELKEYVLSPRVIIGIRRSESTKRAKRYHEPEECRILKGVHQRSYYPILEWTDADVKRFIAERDIQCHPLYYDAQGNFHVERRLGCMGCPLMSRKKRVLEFIKYPKMLRLWILNYQKYLDNNPTSKAFAFTKGLAHNGLFQELFTDNKEYYEHLITGGIFPETAIDAKKYLEDYFKVDLTI